MKIIQQQFQVSYQYPVYFTHGLFGQENPVFRDFWAAHTGPQRQKRLLIVVDQGMADHHPGLEDHIRGYLKTLSAPPREPVFLSLPGGEAVKNDLLHVDRVLGAIHEHGIDRHSFVVAIGGGAVLDLVGYAAAVAHRGVRHLRIPTTVLSQNDSGVGVKNGINHYGKKNFLGTFAPPAAVFNDAAFLDTLDDRQWRSGMAEAVKVALIKDAAFFSWLEAQAAALVHRDADRMGELIYRCAALHLSHIASGDPFESGSSRPLDFGHWSAHKLEQLTDFALAHGEAVAIGMALDVLYAERIGWLHHDASERILALLQQLGFELYHPALDNPALLEGLQEFREHLGGALTIMLLRDIGTGENVHEMDKDQIHEALHALKERSAMKV